MNERDTIKDKIDIVFLLSEYIKLQKSGRNFKALCPFHGEKTPSLMISPERQIWHCFGCGKGGDIFTFLMEYEHMDFPEALRLLAKKAGVTLATTSFTTGVSSKKELLYKINGIASEYYHYVLTKHQAGEKAREYLKKRGLSEKIIQTFQLGFAPMSGHDLLNYLLKKKKCRAEDILAAGLFIERQGRLFDFFRDRVMFPLIDSRDNVLGFAGRILHADMNAPKYINTRETLIYHKGEHVYGFNITKEAIRKANQVIIVEGEFDAISCFQNGIANVVAVKGTALTESQVSLLSRFTAKVTFCFDGDKAGQEAIKRSLTIVEKKGVSATVIEIPNGKDPDEALHKDEVSFKKAIKEESDVYDYILKKLLKTYDPHSVEGKKKISEEFLPFLSHIQNEIIKEHYLKRLSQELDVSRESIVLEMERFVKREKTTTLQVLPKVKRPRDELLEKYILSLIVQSEIPKTIIDEVALLLTEIMPKERAFQKLLYALFDWFSQLEEKNMTQFVSTLPKEFLEAYDTCLLLPLPMFEDEQKLLSEATRSALQLKELYIKQKIKTLAGEIKVKEQQQEEIELTKLRQQYQELVSTLGRR